MIGHITLQYVGAINHDIEQAVCTLLVIVLVIVTCKKFRSKVRYLEKSRKFK